MKTLKLAPLHPPIRRRGAAHRRRAGALLPPTRTVLADRVPTTRSNLRLRTSTVTAVTAIARNAG